MAAHKAMPNVRTVRVRRAGSGISAKPNRATTQPPSSPTQNDARNPISAANTRGGHPKSAYENW
jgi:hypothetical protein